MDRDLLKSLHQRAMSGAPLPVSPVDRIAHQIVGLQQTIQKKDPLVAAWHVHTSQHPRGGLRFQLTAISQQAIEYRDHMGALFPISQFWHIDGFDLSDVVAMPLVAVERPLSPFDGWEAST